MRTYGNSKPHTELDTCWSREVGCYHMTHGEGTDSSRQAENHLTTGVFGNTTIKTQ
jgi:hypothetical protein